MTFTEINHPLIKHKLTRLRDKSCPNDVFRRSLREISLLLGYEVMKDLPLTTARIETPLEAGDFPVLDGRRLCFVSILRAGNGLLEGLLDLVPDARVGHIGVYRDHETLDAIEYYFKVPEALDEREVIVVDPMLATGHTAVAALHRLKQAGAKNIKFVCLVAAPEGVAELERAHADVPIFAAALDRQLNDEGYICPGLGDAGDRIYGTA